MDDRELKRVLLRGVYCGKCGREASIGPCVCSPAPKPTPVKVEDLDAAIRERLDDGRDGDAVRVVLGLHAPTYFGYADGDRYAGQPPDCAVCEDPGGVPSAWPCSTAREVAKAMGIEVADA